MNPTRVITLLPHLDGKGYSENIYKPEQKKMNPNGEVDLIKDIVVYTEPQIFVEIIYENFGTEWIMDHISFIEYARDGEAQNNESGD